MYIINQYKFNSVMLKYKCKRLFLYLSYGSTWVNNIKRERMHGVDETLFQPVYNLPYLYNKEIL